MIINLLKYTNIVCNIKKRHIYKRMSNHIQHLHFIFIEKYNFLV